MKLQSGKLYENRTWRYIYPCLRYYGPMLKGYLNTFYKLGTGIGDHNVESEGYCIYILIDTKVHSVNTPIDTYRENISKFLDWVRNEDYYVRDYVLEGLDTCEKHMVVLKIPEVFNKSYQKFCKGRYSEMYSESEINEYFQFVQLKNKEVETKLNEKLQVTRAILNKNPAYLPEFRASLNKEFSINLSLEELKYHELDFPPNLEEEIFNYKIQEHAVRG